MVLKHRFHLLEKNRLLWSREVLKINISISSFAVSKPEAEIPKTRPLRSFQKPHHSSSNPFLQPHPQPQTMNVVRIIASQNHGQLFPACLQLDSIWSKKPSCRTSLLVQWLKLHLLMQGVQVRTLVRKLRFHMSCSQKSKHETETNSIKTFKKRRKKLSCNLILQTTGLGIFF